MKSKVSLCWAVLSILLLPSAALLAHCEIPCGIYDDGLRISLLKEHCDTIEKSMKMIVQLSTEEVANYNQIVRWVNNKEDHANHIQDIVSQYFMTQRVKPLSDDEESERDTYMKKLALLHRVLVEAMKAKQTVDLGHVEELRKLIAEFEGFIQP
jgi:nickel superoxide dismutase